MSRKDFKATLLKSNNCSLVKRKPK